MSWQYAIADAINTAMHHLRPHVYDYSVIIHPAIDQEIEGALHENIWLRIGLGAVFLGLLAANTYAIVRLWRVLRRGSEPHVTEPPT